MGMLVGQNNTVVPEILEDRASPIADRLASNISEVSPAELGAAWEELAVSTDVVAKSSGDAGAELLDDLKGASDNPAYQGYIKALEVANNVIGAAVDNVVGPVIDGLSAAREFDNQIRDIIIGNAEDVLTESGQAFMDYIRSPLGDD